MSKTLKEVLNGHLANSDWSFEKLAEAAGLPRSTVYRWTRDEVARVRHWDSLIKAARALELNKFQANKLLELSGHPSIEVLLERATDEEDRALLSRWAITTPNNLPAQLTSFIGRAEELQQLTRLLPSARLVTLTGTGGSGKTRLALEVAQSVLDEFEGVYFVDLAAVRDPKLVIPTIAQTLDLRESRDQPSFATLKTYLRDRNVLLVLDNFEQVIEAAPHLTALLSAAQRAKALVTSRTRLNVRGEHEFAVLPFSLPDAAAGFEELTHNPAVAVFADRARAVSPSFTLTTSSAPIVAEVCMRLDGLPLAIELAAARTRQVSLSSMRERFPGRLVLASGGPRDVHDRQRTLRATIAWSYDLLEDAEQRLFRSIGVFAGGFTREAAGAVCAALGHPEIDVPGGLESLADWNLLRRIMGDKDEPRYEMLETLREYALEGLNECREEDTARRAAAEYYLGMAERAELELEGQAFWLHRLVAELDNFRAALGWCRKRGQIETGLRLCIALTPLWQLKEYRREASAWLEAFMVAEGKLSPNLRAMGLLWRGMFLVSETGDNLSASRLYEEALGLFRDGGDLNGASETLQAQGDVYRNQGEWKRASERYAESLELAQRTGNAYLVAHGWLGLAMCAQEEGKFDAAQRYWELTLECAERAGNEASVALALNSLGEMARYRGDWETAERYYERTLVLGRELGSEFRVAMALHNLGYVDHYKREPERATRRFMDSLLLYKGRQYQKGVAECLAGLGKVAASVGSLERAARLCGATEAILEDLDTRLDTLDRADFERTLAMLRCQLGERLETLLDEGRAMSMEDVVKYATDHCTVR